MGRSRFNEESEKPEFIFKRNPLTAHAWQIFQLKEGKNEYEPVGDYTLINQGEPIDITEKKLSNLVGIMNGKQTLIDFTNLTKERVLFNIISGDPDSNHQKVLFRTYDGKGVSKENAVLTIEKGVFNESE